jgi:GxxExxY protein
LTAEIAENAEILEKSSELAVDERDKLNGITEQIIGAAIEVHRVVGPGLLESAYEACLVFELRERGFKVEKPLPVVYKRVKLDCGYRLDIVVEDSVIVEIKAVERLNSIHEAQMLSYLRLYGCRVGLLINFHVPMLKHGIRRVVNEFPDSAISANSAVQ